MLNHNLEEDITTDLRVHDRSERNGFKKFIPLNMISGESWKRFVGLIVLNL